MRSYYLDNLIEALRREYASQEVTISELLTNQKLYHKQHITVRGTVVRILNIDYIGTKTTDTWLFDLPQTIPITKSATFFYLEDEFKKRILIKYPSDLELKKGDEVIVSGTFSAHDVYVEYKTFFGKKEKKTTTKYNEPFVSAVFVENLSNSRVEHIQRI